MNKKMKILFYSKNKVIINYKIVVAWTIKHK